MKLHHPLLVFCLSWRIQAGCGLTGTLKVEVVEDLGGGGRGAGVGPLGEGAGISHSKVHPGVLHQSTLLHTRSLALHQLR